MQSEPDELLSINLYFNTHPLVWRLEDALQGRDVIEVCPQPVKYVLCTTGAERDR